MASVNRRLAAIVMADVVGYSRLMERDEAGTHARLRELREQLVDPKIVAHGGRVVSTSGDGVLIEFPSATSALRCAVEIQREMEPRNAGVAAEDRLDLRIGINLGDIIVDGHDIAGDGVNIAARLESLSDPGGICVSAIVRDQVHEDLGVGFVDTGEQQLKNIAKPVRVFNIDLGGAQGRSLWRRAAPRRWRRVGAAAAMIALAVIAVVVWRGFPREPAQQGPDAAPWGTVLVLPFAAAPGDPALPPLASRLTADFTNALGDTLRRARVVPAARAASLAAEASDPQEIGRKAGANWLFGGELKPDGKQLVFTLRLLDVADGRQVGSTRKDYDRSQIGELEPLLRRLVSDARQTLASAVIDKSRKEGRQSADDLLNRAGSFTDPDLVKEAKEQIRLLDEALKLDPTLARAWVQRGEIPLNLYFFGFSDGLGDREKVVAGADADSLRAVTLDPLDPAIWIGRGKALAYVGNAEASRAAFDKAIALDPTRFGPAGVKAWAMLKLGDPQEALAGVEKTRQAAGGIGGWGELIICQARLALGESKVAIPACERAAASLDVWMVPATLAAAYALQGETTKAAEQKEKLLKQVPGFTIARYEARKINPTPEGIAMDQRYFIPGLRKAGVPE